MDFGTPNDTIQNDIGKYQPKSKSERLARRTVYERYHYMRDSGFRKDAEKAWDEGDKMFMQYQAPVDVEDWRSHLVLPDGFAAIQAQMQETLDRKSRPVLEQVEISDDGIEHFGNAIMNHNMNRTNFDFEYFRAKYAASIRGTAFLLDYYRIDKRTVKDPVSVNPDGTIKYQNKEIVDFDDDYTEWIPNEYIHIDEAAKHISEARDCIRREILHVNEFKRIYGTKPDFKNTEFVVAGGEVGTTQFFQMPRDLDEKDVEVLHYYNRATDDYFVVANNVVVRQGPLPWKHKELPIAVVYHYYVPGQFWGLGIPAVIKNITAERQSGRNLNMDRQKAQLNKMFLYNSAFDLDEEDLTLRPHGLIAIDTNGAPLDQVIRPIEYGDVPASYFRTDEILLEDTRRAHGIDDRIQGAAAGGTATQAAILKESSTKRINMIAQLAEMDTLIRIGRLKWSNIQFFYPTPTVERIMEGNDEREEKTYKHIVTRGQSFNIVKGEDDKNKLQWNKAEGKSSFELNKAMARFMEGDWDVTIDANAFGNSLSKPVQQSKITEMFNLVSSVPTLLGIVDAKKAVTRYLEINNEDPENWLKGNGMSDHDWQVLADKENMVMASGQPLGGTEDAPQEHTMIHLMYTKSAEFQKLPAQAQQLIQAHIMEEHDANPATGSSADALAGAQPAGGPQAGGAPPFFPSAPVSPLSTLQNPTEPVNPAMLANTRHIQPSTADFQASGVGNARQ